MGYPTSSTFLSKPGYRGVECTLRERYMPPCFVTACASAWPDYTNPFEVLHMPGPCALQGASVYLSSQTLGCSPCGLLTPYW